MEESTPLLNPKETTEITEAATGSGQTKIREVELKVYREGKGPIAVIKSGLGGLGGYEQDQLEVQDILDQFGFKSIYAFNPSSATRTVPIRFNARNGRSLLPYRDGAIICVDGQPKDSLIKPITRIMVGVVLLTILIAVVTTETPALAKKFNLTGFRIPPWLLTCAVIVFTRMRKRTVDFLRRRGWF